MTLPKIAKLPFSDPSWSPLDLCHAAIGLNKKQRRLLGRTTLEPAIDLEAYLFKAVIDWIEFRVHLNRRTQLQHLHEFLLPFSNRTPYITRQDKGAGDVFSVCTIKIQEPVSLAHVTLIHQAIVAKYGEVAPSCVTGIEISVDAYAKDETEVARALMVGAMQRTIWTDRDIWTNANSRPRTCVGLGKNTTRLVSAPEKDDQGLSRTVPENHIVPYVDGTMYLGAKDDDVMIRVMDKIKDGQHPDGNYVALTDKTSRARIEVTVKGDELSTLGLTDIPSLKQFKLTELQGRYFQFRLPTFMKSVDIVRGADLIRNTKETWRRRTYLRSGVVGLMSADEVTHLRRKKMMREIKKTALPNNGVTMFRTNSRLSTNTFVAYEALNRAVALALRHLATREDRAWRKLVDR